MSLFIILLLAALSFYYFKDSSSQEELNKNRLELVSVLKEARSESILSKSAYQYGVHIDPEKATLFHGDTFSPTDPDNKEFYFAPGVSATSNLNGGGNDVIFSRLYGATSNYGSITLTLSKSPYSSTTVSISSIGVIQ